MALNDKLFDQIAAMDQDPREVSDPEMIPVSRELTEAAARPPASASQIEVAMAALIETVNTLAKNQHEIYTSIQTLTDRLEGGYEKSGTYERDLLKQKQALAREPMVEVVNYTDSARFVGVNGAGYVIQPGINRVPKTVADEYQKSTDQLERAVIRARLLAGKSDYYDVQAIVEGR